MMTIREQLTSLRGGEYFDVWVDWWRSSDADSVRAEVQSLTDSRELTPITLFRVKEKFDLPWKTFVEQLEKDGILRTGIYDRLPSLDRIRKTWTQRQAQGRPQPTQDSDSEDIEHGKQS